MTDRPPQWADALLQLLLNAADRESVSGDLIEQYRDEIVPAHGRQWADLWYVGQVAGFLWRATWFWAVVFGGAYLIRTAYDWLVPTTDFVARSTVTTAVGVATLACVGFWTAWRSGSVVAGVVVTALTSQVAAVLSVAGATVLLAVWHDAETLSAIRGSGGLGEVYVLPFMAIVPALVLGVIGGAAGRLSRRLLS
jgi:hypothetical protein